MVVAEARAVLEAATLVPALGLLRRLPKGDGHHVLLIPPFLASDVLTAVARAFLGRQGYVVHSWGHSEVLGLHQLVTVGVARLEEVVVEACGKVSVVGHSLGGIYAREIARQAPQHVRCVISLGSPFAGDLKANYVWPLYEVFTGTRVDSIPTALLERLNTPPGVPTTAVYTRGDGVASWWTCVELAGPGVENVGVRGSHLGLLHNPLALYVIADRLAQPEGQWKPFQPRGLLRALYRR
jgi:pimeloyl-ACP methyl ester carboxylesterase